MMKPKFHLKMVLLKLSAALPESWVRGAMRCAVATLLAGAALLSLRGDEIAPQSSNTNHPFRLAFTTSMFTEVNVNDARAAMKVWIMTVAKERSIPVDPELRIYQNAEELLQDCRTNEVDGFGLVTPEFARLSQTMEFDRLAVGMRGGSLIEEYVLLVRQDSGVDKLEQLQGRKLNVFESPRMDLGSIWLDSLVLQARHQHVADFFGQVKSFNKASRVALPVFFHQADACLLTRSSFLLMGELNPQLGQQMRILAVSPAMVPSCFAFRKDFVSPYRSQLLAEMSRMNETPAGQQILTLTQTDQIQEQPVSCLDDALKMLAEHQLFCAAAIPTNAPGTNASMKPITRGGG